MASTSPFNTYEAQVLRSQLRGTFADDAIDDIIENSEHMSYEFTGVGYFLEARHPLIGKNRVVLSGNEHGRYGDLLVGFVTFMQDGSLTLECFSYDAPVPENLRSLAVEIF